MKFSEYSPEMHQRFFDIREALGLTQEEIGKQIGYSDAYYGKIERPGSSIGANIVIAVCHVFNVNYDYLVYGEEPMFNTKDQQQKGLDEKYDQMSESLREFLLRYADMLLEAQDDYIIEKK